MVMMANRKTLTIHGLINLDFGHEKSGIVTFYTSKSVGNKLYFYSGFALAILAGLLYSFCFTFMQLMELCTDREHRDVKGSSLHYWYCTD